MPTRAEILSQAEAEIRRATDLLDSKEAQLDRAKERLDALEDSDDFGGDEMDAAEREVERLEQDLSEASDDLASAISVYEEYERDGQDDD
jgi:DNA repair exonuclease SbcCD ATPase subunit